MSEQVYLIGAGSLPGIPGVLGPGLYEIDYDARTATPVGASPTISVTPTVEAAPTPDPNATQPLVDSTSVQTQDETTTTAQ
jgi:hypothetical protein